jgi:dCTP deaminase
MILASNELKKLIERGVVDALPENVSDIAIDVRLSNVFTCERPPDNYSNVVSLASGEIPNYQVMTLPSSGRFFLNPGAFCLTETVEYFEMPNDLSGLFTLRSALARSGLDQSVSFFLKPGWRGRLVLELRNNLRYHELALTPGQLIGQVTFFQNLGY